MMSISKHISTSFTRIFTIALVLCLFIDPAISKTKHAIFNYHLNKLNKDTFLENADSSQKIEQDKKEKDSEKQDQPGQKKKEIKEVPKSRKQSKPVVVKPDVKVKPKPVRVMKPKIKKH